MSTPLKIKGYAIAASDSGVWVADVLGRDVIRVEPASGAVGATIAVGGQPSAIAIAPEGSIWVTIQGP